MIVVAGPLFSVVYSQSAGRVGDLGGLGLGGGVFYLNK